MILTRVLLLATSSISAACATGAPAAEPERVVTVLVHNIHAGRDADGAPNLERIAALIRSTEADVVLLQEVDRNTARSGPADHPAELARRTGFAVAFRRTIPFQGGDYGLAVLSRWPIRSDTLIPLPLPDDIGARDREPRGVLLAVIDAPGGPLAVMNTHLDAGRDETWRALQTATLVRVARGVRDAGVLVLGGDLNAVPESGVHDALRDAGFRDAWTECGSGEGATFPAAAPVRRIDYLYLTGAAVCDRAEVPVDDASDHRPLLVRVRLR